MFMFSLLFSSLIPLSLVSFLKEASILSFIIVFGQAHFLMAYFYQKKAGKIDKKYLIRFGLLFLFLGGICSYIFYSKNLVSLLIFVSVTIFVYHYFKDELKIQGFENIENKLFALSSVVLSFASVFLIKIFNVDYIYVYFLFFLSLVFSAIFVLGAFEKLENKRDKSLVFLFFVINVIMPIWFIFMENITILKIAGFIILLHYIRWYLYYFNRFKGEHLNYYLNVIASFNFLMVVLFVLYTNFSLFSFLFIIFDPIFFYGWTILHIFSTFKK